LELKGARAEAAFHLQTTAAFPLIHFKTLERKAFTHQVPPINLEKKAIPAVFGQ
jgi:hypothetical protein